MLEFKRQIPDVYYNCSYLPRLVACVQLHCV